jgi:hypothetical protein
MRGAAQDDVCGVCGNRLALVRGAGYSWTHESRSAAAASLMRSKGVDAAGAIKRIRAASRLHLLRTNSFTKMADELNIRNQLLK